MSARKWGSETQVNTNTSGNQQFADVVALPDGGFVVVWQDEDATGGDGSLSCIKMQRFDTMGEKVGGEVIVNTTTLGNQTLPQIAATIEGFVVVWRDGSGLARDGDDIRYRRYDAECIPLDETDRIVTVTGNTTDVWASVSTWIGGGFVIVSQNVTGEINYSVFNANGLQVFNSSIVIESNFSSQPDIAILRNEDVVAAYVDEVTGNVLMQISADSVIFSSSVVVNDTPHGDIADPDILALANGGFVIAWSDFSGQYPDTERYAVRMRAFTPDGVAFGPEVTVNTNTVHDQKLPDMVALADGGFAVIYESNASSVIRGQLFNADLSRRGAEFTVSNINFDEHEEPAVTLLADGRIAVVWSNELGNLDGDTSGASVQVQIIDPRDGIIDGDAGNNLLHGHDVLGDIMTGFGGNDTLIGLAGNDQLNGGNGDDTLLGGKGDDIAWGGIGDDELAGNSGEDDISGEAGNDTLRGGRDDDVLFGGDGQDRLFGGDGADVLNGGQGLDTAGYTDAGGSIIVSLDGSLTPGGAAIGDQLISIENLTGSTFSDTLVGSAAANTISGVNGSDIIDGKAGNDKIIGGRAADTLTGGSGNDAFRYLTLSDGEDLINDFSSTGAGNNDRFEFKGTSFANLPAGKINANEFQKSTSSVAADADIRFLFETDTGILRFDADGNGSAAAIIIATLQSGATMSINDIAII
ncbi:calcium-binding protein [Aestuariivirga sp.]|uniref:calcium-binding protein n=1 Tax=Aestuariivirga sp. TaxID=2650926 RepID=UPI003593ED2C